MEHLLCPLQKTESSQIVTVKLHCRSCPHGQASLFDPTCRKNIFVVLSRHPDTNQLILNHAMVKLYKNENLNYLKTLSKIIDQITLCHHLHHQQRSEQGQKIQQDLLNQLKHLSDLAQNDPLAAYSKIITLHQTNEIFTELLEIINQNIDSDTTINKISTTHSFQHIDLQPYVRPGFLDCYLQIKPPKNAIFVTSYEITSVQTKPARVNLYQSPTTIENLYYLIPPEINLSQQDLSLLEQVRDKLTFHRPEDTEFLNPNNSRDYFKRFARKTITSLLKEQDHALPLMKIDELAEIFSRNTSGYGIIEYLLQDDHIQDIYINAPVTTNPLHLVVNGEEYTSNIFISEDDVQALASRFRSLSGRPFSEASPVLDMDLHPFHTRIAAINNPLTPKGMAFALRRHRKHPWTLAHFVKNRTLSSYAAGLLSLLIDGQTSLLIAGSRGSGKTSLLTALINEIPKRFRILTIEDTPEIPIEQYQTQGYKMQSLVTKSMLSSEKSTELSPTHALRTALRLGESVLILGEVRGQEAKVLFESMRVGAAGNLIMGTIHGSTTHDVFERVVYDIGVAPSSFKAVEAVIILAPIRIEGGLDKKRRVIQLSETRKTDFIDPIDPDHLFSDLLVFNSEKDGLEQSDTLVMGQSELIASISKKWGVTIETILENITLRAYIKEQIVAVSENHPEVLEATCVQDANTTFWMLIEKSKILHQTVDYSYVRSHWKQWFDEYIKKEYHATGYPLV